MVYQSAQLRQQTLAVLLIMDTCHALSFVVPNYCQASIFAQAATHELQIQADFLAEMLELLKLLQLQTHH